MRLVYFSLFILAIIALAFVGCEGPEGPQGEAGPQGPMNDGYTYLGDNANTCNHCHGENVMTWMDTHHHEAYEALDEEDKNNLYCVQCHVTGFDAEVEYGDTIVVTPGPDMFGFDDYWPPETEEDEMRVEDLKNVQCEACHGSMGPTIYEHAPILTFTTRIIDGEESSMCAKCHEQVEEWHESGHGMVLETHDMTIEEFSDEWDGSCADCHTAEGFAADNDGYWAAEGLPETLSLVGCPACHDPHDATNEHQLRNLDDYTVLYDAEEAATFTGNGNAQLCAQCHHARRSTSNVQGQIENGYAHFGPHGSPQMDMCVGSGSYEIEGYDYEREHAHQATVNWNNEPMESCVSCHMEMRSHSDPLGWKGGHDFEPTPATCSSNCHAVPDDFNYAGLVTDINDKLEQLEALIGVDPEYYGNADSTTVEQRMAAYAYVFVMNDGSHGIHNPSYATSLLDNAIAFMEEYNSSKGQEPLARR